MRPFAIATVVALWSGQTPHAQPTTNQRSICVAPFVADPTGRKGAGMPRCDGDHYSLKIDDRPFVDWPAASARIDGLDPAVRHRVVIRCDGKPHQSFGFRLSEFHSKNELCLFINDLYRTANLWDSKPPWCKCQ